MHARVRDVVLIWAEALGPDYEFLTTYENSVLVDTKSVQAHHNEVKQLNDALKQRDSKNIVIWSGYLLSTLHRYVAKVGRVAMDKASRYEQIQEAFFKEGAELPADTTVTVSIGAPARAWAGILTESGPAAGYSSVTYQSCSSKSRPGRVFWVGGFTLGGKTSACVPLEVLVAGESQPRTLMLSLEAGKCG